MGQLAVEGGHAVRTKPWAFDGTIEIGELEKQYVLQALEGSTLFRFFNKEETSFPARLEKYYRDRLGVPYALAVNSGTSALICALAAAGVGPGDEVIVPAYTYIATAAAVCNVGAVPIIVECDDTLNMDPNALEAAITPYTKAVIVVHMRGVMAQMNEISAVAKKRGLILVEDVAQANGGSYFGRQLGSIGDFGCFSLQSFKVITAGEGGVVVTKKSEWIARARHKHDAGYQFWPDASNIGSFPGENYRMSEMNGALAFAQTHRIDDILTRTRAIKRRILEGIRDIPGLTAQRIVDPEGDCAIQIIFFLENSELAGTFSQALNAEGIKNGTIHNGGFADRHIYKNWDYVMEKRMASPVGTPWNNAEYKGNATYHPDMCPKTLDYLGRAIAIGLNQHLTEEDCDDAVEAVRKVAERYLG